jgi:hypothetical protein
MEAPYFRRIAGSLLARLRAWLEKLKDNPGLLEETAALPADYKALEAVHGMFIRSCLMGMEAASAGKRRAEKNFADPLLLPEMPLEALPFEEAVAFLKTQIPLKKDGYYALDDKMRLRAFTVGRLNDCDAVNRVKGIIGRNLEQGGTLADFYNMTDAEILNGAGFGGGDMSYWQTVYRTNEDAIHNAGRAMGFEAVPPVALELAGVNDMRQSEICRTLTQPPFIRPYNDPVWKTLWPPFHFCCRTYVHGIYDTSELDAWGDPEQAFRQGSYAAPDKGFGGYPLDRESYWQLSPEMLERAREYGIDGEVATAAINLGMKNYALDLVKGYDTIYTSASGGYVKKAGLANPGKENRFDKKGRTLKTDELGLAKKAADGGHRIFFLPKTKVQGIRNPDTIIDGEIAEIKHVFKPSGTAVNTAVQGAKDQGAGLVLMAVSDQLSWETINKEAGDRIGSHVKKALVFWRGKIHAITKTPPAS